MIDTKPTNKIMAIKAIRELPVRLEVASVNDDGKVSFTGKVSASLGELKTLVESIMFIDTQYSETCTKLRVENANLNAEIERLQKYKKAYITLRDGAYDALNKASEECYGRDDDNEPSY